MKPGTTKSVYWIITIVFSLLMIFDGIGGIIRAEEGQVVMRHLGYPIYAMSIFGVAKVFGAAAILQQKYVSIKEWAYAGFAFNFIGAAASRAYVGDEVFSIIFPLIVLMVMLVSYFLWKRISMLKQEMVFSREVRH